jgi:hypothetical protein
VTRGLGLLTLVLTLVASAYLFAAQWGGTGGAPKVSDAERSGAVAAANTVAASVAAAQAERELALFHDANGTYAGATVHADGVQVIRADATSYCLRIEAGETSLYDGGPGGRLASKPC